MANMLDYLAWRGDLTGVMDGYNAVDALIMASISYNELPMDSNGAMPMSAAAKETPLSGEGASKYVRQWRQLLTEAGGSRRFGDFIMRRQVSVVDPSRSIQFAAVTAQAPDGAVFVCFRGTDNSVVGWREDFTMGFETPVPAQTAAAEYLAEEALRPGGPIRVVGHSKGGNLALYAAVHASEAAQRRIKAVYSFDGPGLDEESMSSDGCARLAGRIHSLIPQGSVVGLLLSYHPDYTIVRSNGVGILQHDAFTWQVMGNAFLRAEQLSRGSEFIDRSLHQWLKTCTPDQRRVFVNTLFDVIEASDAKQFSDVRKNLGAVGAAIARVDPSRARIVGQLAGSLIGIGAGNLKDLLFGQAAPSQQDGLADGNGAPE